MRGVPRSRAWQSGGVKWTMPSINGNFLPRLAQPNLHCPKGSIALPKGLFDQLQQHDQRELAVEFPGAKKAT